MYEDVDLEIEAEVAHALMTYGTEVEPSGRSRVLGLCSSTFARVRYTTVVELSRAVLEAGRTIVVAAELQPL